MASASSRYVFNADETALFYRMQYSKIFTLKTEKQVFKKRTIVTLLVARSSVGNIVFSKQLKFFKKCFEKLKNFSGK